MNPLYHVVKHDGAYYVMRGWYKKAEVLALFFSRQEAENYIDEHFSLANVVNEVKEKR